MFCCDGNSLGTLTLYISSTFAADDVITGLGRLRRSPPAIVDRLAWLRRLCCRDTIEVNYYKWEKLATEVLTEEFELKCAKLSNKDTIL